MFVMLVVGSAFVYWRFGGGNDVREVEYHLGLPFGHAVGIVQYVELHVLGAALLKLKAF